MSEKLLRWGILGTANIARKNWKAIWNSGNGRVSAVASRDLRRCRRFIRECQAQVPFEPAPRAHGSYEELLADPQVDAVYIPLPTGLRAEWVKRAAAAGKQILCEKPCATSVAELKEMLAACRAHHVQFMDGVMFMHSRRLDRMRKVLEDGKTVGPIKRITSAFTFLAEDEFFVSNIRALASLEPAGCLGDLGWYCIRFALWVLNWELPQQVTARTLAEFKHPRSKLPITTDFSAELFFAGGVTSSFYCSFLTENEQWANVSGTRGHLHVRDFVLPFAGRRLGFETANPAFEIRGCDFAMHPRPRQWTVQERSHGHPTAQESRMFRNFARQVRSGELNPLWPEIALKTQRVMETCRESARKQGQLVNLR